MQREPLIIGLTGTNASGKGTVAQFLKSKGFLYFSCSDVIREELRSKNIPATRANMILEGNRLRKAYGAGILAVRLKEKITKDTVVDSIRNPSEVDEFRKLAGFLLIAIDAPIETRFKRAMERGRAENASTLKEFKLLEDRERAGSDILTQSLDKTMQLADYRIINDSTVVHLYEEVQKILKIRKG